VAWPRLAANDSLIALPDFARLRKMHDARPTRLVILTGAGASKPLGLPLMTGILDGDFWKSQLDRRARTVAYLAERWSWSNVSGVDLEYVYTLAYLLSGVTAADPLSFAINIAAVINLALPGDGNQKQEIRLHVDDIRSGAETLREWIHGNIHLRLAGIDPHRAAELYKGLLKPLALALPRPATIDIFTTNYDRAIEKIWTNGLQKEALGSNYHLVNGFATRNEYLAGKSWYPASYDEENRPKGDVIRLFKLHGSLNWRRGDDGNIVETEADEYQRDRSALIYPLRGLKGPQLEPFETLFRFWDDALSTATDCVVVGSSLRDSHVAKALELAAEQSSTFRLWIVDPKAENIRAALSPAAKKQAVTISATLETPGLGDTLASTLIDPLARLEAKELKLAQPPSA
jgi:hypothetical protein